jgi:hypothetical protein
VAKVCIIPEDDESECTFMEVENSTQIPEISKIFLGGSVRKISVDRITEMYVLESASSSMAVNDRATRLLLVALERPAQLIYGPALVFGVNLDGAIDELGGSAVGYLSDMRLMDIMLPVLQV